MAAASKRKPWKPEARCPKCNEFLNHEHKRPNGLIVRYCSNKYCTYVYVSEKDKKRSTVDGE